jgi:Lon protease (S16) C-terminal proteolytic domain
MAPTPFRAGNSSKYAGRFGRLGGAFVAKREWAGIIRPPKTSYPSYFFNSGCVDHTAAHGSLQDLGSPHQAGTASPFRISVPGAQLVVLGQMSLHGVLSRVEGLGDKLRVAMDAGAQRVLIPTENSCDFATLPAEVLDKLRIEFYSEPSQAAFKALAE